MKWKIKVRCAKTNLLFGFNTHEDKERFFDLWDKHEIMEGNKDEEKN